MSTIRLHRAKVATIFEELVGQKAGDLCEGLCDGAVAERVKEALLLVNDEMDEETARDIGFHLSDWHVEAAFIVALHLFPERFTPKEIADGVLSFIIHAPNHAAAAAALHGHPVEDVFGVFPAESKSSDEDL
jgi:hypothetical protein